MTTHYVDSASGNDAYDGTQPRPTAPSSGPWRTIQKATEAARMGDTVLVAPGMYQGPMVIRTSNTSWLVRRPSRWQRFKTWLLRRPALPLYAVVESPTLPLMSFDGEAHDVYVRGFHWRQTGAEEVSARLRDLLRSRQPRSQEEWEAILGEEGIEVPKAFDGR